MRLRVTRPALRDLESISSYISADRPSTAAKVVAQLLDRAHGIAAHPNSGQVTDRPTVRLVVVPQLRYRIYYSIMDDEIRILHFRHTSRKPWLGR